jgi:hypothetical protein
MSQSDIISRISASALAGFPIPKPAYRVVRLAPGAISTRLSGIGCNISIFIGRSYELGVKIGFSLGFHAPPFLFCLPQAEGENQSNDPTLFVIATPAGIRSGLYGKSRSQTDLPNRSVSQNHTGNFYGGNPWVMKSEESWWSVAGLAA